MIPFSRSQFPEHGWQFFQPQTGWHAPMPMGSTFDSTVTQIIRHRLDNGAITAKHNLRTDVAGVADELENYTRARLGMPLMGADAPKSQPPQVLPPAVRGAVAAAARLAEGVGFLIDWLPTGVTVEAPLSAKRGETCAACPKNSDKAFASFFTQPVSDRLRKMLEARKDLKLETPSDDKLGVCEVCLCPMKLKVHVPLQDIVTKTKPATLAEFPPNCWIARRDQ